MAVVIETTLGDITIDLYIDQRPKACLNFLKLCRMKYYNFNLFHTVNQGFIAQTGDPTGSRIGGESIWGVIDGASKRYYEAENTPRIKHTTTGLVSFVGDKDSMIGSQFFITLAPDLTYLDAQHCVFGEVTEGFEILRLLNESICDTDHRPYQDIRITHTVVLEDPFPDPENLKVPDGSPEPTAERLQGGRIAPDEEIDETEGKTVHEVQEIIAEKEAKARATILEMIGDIPDAEMAPPENVLFVCKLNPVTTDDDLEIIFSRFGKIKTCEVIRDKKSGDSLQYAFVEFEEQKSCEDAYFKMDNVLIDDRRIHVDFSQSVAKIKWHGKGRGVTHYNEKGEKQKDDPKNDVGNGRYRKKETRESPKRNSDNRRDERAKSRDRYENGNNRNRNEYRPAQNNRDRQNERYRDDRYRQNDRNRYQDNYSRDRRNDNFESRREYRPENRRQRSRSRENERFRRNRSRSADNTRSRQDEREYKRKEERSRSRSRDNQRSTQVEREYKRKDERIASRPRQNQRPRPEETEYRRKQDRSRSKSRDNQRSRQRNLSPDEKENKKKELEKSRKYQENSSEEESKKKKKSKKKRKDSSDEDSSSEGTPVKKSKKLKKKKSKKKKAKSESDSDSDSSTVEERKKSKKKKKKSKKRESSSDSDSDSDSDVPQKKNSKKR